ncbi:Hypothetical_protein [Hexamita inflata]|uniref:Hypothetical_protein n=1 Tax=Hexamita inflata TaxID=28002 RepID=A0AA86P5Z7_9EUKA|nr:Hypothetical protein HINF_LOCUS19933 [Hexamita inflata]
MKRFNYCEMPNQITAEQIDQRYRLMIKALRIERQLIIDPLERQYLDEFINNPPEKLKIIAFQIFWNTHSAFQFFDICKYLIQRPNQYTVSISMASYFDIDRQQAWMGS